MTPNDVADLLRTTIELLTPVDLAIFEWPNAPRPDTHYATVGINDMLQVGFREFKDSNATDGDLDRKHDTLFNITIGVNFFKPDSMYSASLFSGGLVTQEVTDLWNAQGVALVLRSNIRDLTQVVNSSFEDRAQLDITMQALISPPDEKVLGVDQVHIVGDVQNATGTVANVEISGPPLT